MPQATTLTPTGDIEATDRKESAYDTEVIAGQGNALPASGINVFQNFSAFANVQGQVNIEQKQRGRDTNITGSNGALPQGYQLLWYEWRCSIRTLGANLDIPQFTSVFEQMERIRENGSIKAVFTQSPLITAPLRDLVSFIDAKFVSTTNANQTAITPCIAGRGGKVIAIAGGSGADSPFAIVGLEQLEMQITWPGAGQVPIGQGGPLYAVVPFYALVLLDGIMSRAAM